MKIPGTIATHWRSLALGGALLFGALLPWAHHLNFLIRYLVIGMLFVTFLRMKTPHLAFRYNHLSLLAANLAMGPLVCASIWLLTGSRDLALTGFFVGAAPTATAAPVVMTFLNGRSEYVLLAFVLTTAGAALAMPLMLTPLLGDGVPRLGWDIFTNMVTVVAIPLAAALVFRIFYRRSGQLGQRLGTFSFILWVASLFLITANASDFFFAGGKQALPLMIGSGVVALLVCAANFTVGYFIGGKEFPREASQSLGQKNTALTIYLALTYAGPVVAIGAAFYVLWHNLWNAIQLAKFRMAEPDGRKPGGETRSRR